MSTQGSAEKCSREGCDGSTALGSGTLKDPPAFGAAVDSNDGSLQPAEARGDYRFFRFLAIGGSRMTLAGLVFLAWYIVAYRMSRTAVDVPIFLLSTTAVALVVSLIAGMTSYTLFKRRGGKIEKTPKPPGVP
jgi:hypothetical protein